ncbi:MAG: response regulator transcription factor [Treponema sp.]|nr:response regulator transcription factor [Treponema sp.]
MEVLLVDDHDLINTGVAALLAGTGYHTVAGQVQSLADAKRFVEEAAEGTVRKMPSLVLLDIQLDKENGLDFIPFLKKLCRAKRIKMPPVLICSILEDHFLMRLALEMGASGFVPKSSGSEELLRAINAACLGSVYIPDTYSGKMVEITNVYELFSRREKEALVLLRQGKNNQQIADAMGILKRTVENIISNIYLKTGIVGREGLMEM